VVRAWLVADPDRRLQTVVRGHLVSELDGVGDLPTAVRRARPTLRQVAERSGLSLKTASRVLSGDGHVTPETAARIRVAAEELGFRPNSIARELRSGARSRLVGLIIGDLTNPFYSRLARGVERALRKRGLSLITASTDEDEAVERTLIDNLLERRVRALLIVPSAHQHAYLEAERRLGLPVVFLDRRTSGVQADGIVLDNRAGARGAVEHMLRRGHRRIGMVGDFTRLSTHRERSAGFTEAMTAAGVVGLEELMRSEAHNVDAAQASTRDLLALPDPPTALFTTNNRITVGALRALRGVGVDRVPALVGFDDFDLADLLGVTVVAHDPGEMGRLATELALARLDGFDGPARLVTLPTRLVPRGSGERPPH